MRLTFAYCRQGPMALIDDGVEEEEDEGEEEKSEGKWEGEGRNILALGGDVCFRGIAQWACKCTYKPLSIASLLLRVF